MVGPDWTAVLIVLFVIPLPFIFTFGFVAYRHWLRHREMERMLEERRLLIERGVTDLPPLQLPEEQHKRDRLANLKAGVVLLAIAAALWLLAVFTEEPLMGHVQVQIAAVLGAIGLALLVVHAMAEYYRRRNGRMAEVPPEPEQLPQEADEAGPQA
jgi:uncharacterized membrane protein